MNADRVITVSPNYAQEIQTPGGGFNLQDFVRAKNQANRLAGILNGIDDCWNPDVDSNIFHNYSVGDHVSGKRSNKLALQRLLHLREDSRRSCAPHSRPPRGHLWSGLRDLSEGTFSAPTRSTALRLASAGAKSGATHVRGRDLCSASHVRRPNILKRI